MADDMKKLNPMNWSAKAKKNFALVTNLLLALQLLGILPLVGINLALITIPMIGIPVLTLLGLFAGIVAIFLYKRKLGA